MHTCGNEINTDRRYTERISTRTLLSVCGEATFNDDLELGCDVYRVNSSGREEYLFGEVIRPKNNELFIIEFNRTLLPGEYNIRFHAGKVFLREIYLIVEN